MNALLCTNMSCRVHTIREPRFQRASVYFSAPYVALLDRYTSLSKPKHCPAQCRMERVYFESRI
jgi:hypothetical protein